MLVNLVMRLSVMRAKRRHKRDKHKELKHAWHVANHYKHNYETLLAEVKRSPSRVVEIHYDERYPT